MEYLVVEVTLYGVLFENYEDTVAQLPKKYLKKKKIDKIKRPGSWQQ